MMKNNFLKNIDKKKVAEMRNKLNKLKKNTNKNKNLFGELTDKQHIHRAGNPKENLNQKNNQGLKKKVGFVNNNI